MEIHPITLEARHMRLEPLTRAHADALVAAAADGELWKSKVTIVPTRETVADYIQAALEGQASGSELPFVIIRKSGKGVSPVIDAEEANDEKASGALARPLGRARHNLGTVVGTTRFYEISRADRRAAIGYTWLAKGAQRSPVNTEAKLLLLTHAFETWKCVRVELITDVLNVQSRNAILRLGAKQEGILRRHMIMPDGRLRDSVFFSIIDEEWPAVKARIEERLALHGAAVRDSSRG